jgi:hypothetical protein
MKMTIRNLSLQLLILILILIFPRLSFGDAPMPSLESLTKDANLIVVAKVESITTEPFYPLNDSNPILIKGDKQVANAKILDVWKGFLSERVQFLASPIWECDDSTAVVGETVLLFLKDNSKNPYKIIAYNGIGRLPVKDSSVLLYSTLLTNEIKDLLGIPAETFRYSIEVDILKQQVQRILENKK